MNDRRPTNLGAKRCSEWLSACKQLGWLPSQMGMLCDMWWEHHDDNGVLIEPTPVSDNCES